MHSSYKNSDTPPPIMQGSPPPDDQCVPLIDWDRPPWNRWTFQRMSQILLTAPVHTDRTANNLNPLTSAHQEISDISFVVEDGSSTTVAQLIEDTYTDGFLVIHNDKVIHESYYNGMHKHSLHLGQSVSKSVVATAASVLFEQGLIDVNSPVTRYLPELEATAWKGATVQHVLDMTTGVRFNETYDHRDSDVGKTDVACGWKPAPTDMDTRDWPDSVWEQLLTLTTIEAPHGSRFLYRSIETEVLGFIMERVTGKRLPEIISDNLWKPMGAEDHANITVDKLGCSTASGGFSASLRDYARFGKLLLDEGKVNDRQVVPQSWIADIRRGTHGLFSEEGAKEFANGSYRNQFWIEDKEKSTHACLGVFGQLVYVSPEYNMVVAKLSTWPDFLNNTFHRDTIRSCHAIAKKLNG